MHWGQRRTYDDTVRRERRGFEQCGGSEWRVVLGDGAGEWWVGFDRAGWQRRIVSERGRLWDDDFEPGFSACAGDQLNRERNSLAAALGAEIPTKYLSDQV